MSYEMAQWDSSGKLVDYEISGDDCGVAVTNPSGIIPTGFKVLVKSEEGTTSKEAKRIGLIVADVTKERDDAASITGHLIAVSPLAFTDPDMPDEARAKVGQRVVYGKYSGTVIKGRDDEDYRIINDQDVIAVLEF
jgi:co-chaperonin GroES (HSP10)